MSEVHSSTATGSSASPSSAAPPSPPATGGDGAFGSVTNASPNGATTGTDARAQAVQTTFLEPASTASAGYQPPPLFAGGALLPFRNHESGFSAASNALPRSEPSLARADPDVESDTIAEFDRLVGDDPEPDEVQRFFAGLSPVEGERLATERAEAMGNLDGAPAALRDMANRQLMQRDLQKLEAKAQTGKLTSLESQALENIRAAQRSIATIEHETDARTGEPLTAQLYEYDPWAFEGDGRAAVSVGDLGAADHVAVTVSGFGLEMARMDATDSLNIFVESQASALGSGDRVAVLAWVGYDAPSGGLLRGDAAGVVTQRMARAGAERLVDSVDGLHAMRGGDATHLTVIGHSYGATTATIAADEFDLAVGDLILLGSPGTGRASDANDLTTGRDHTWVGSASRDFVTSLGVTGAMDPTQVLAAVHGVPPELLGADPAEDDFHAQRFQAENIDRGDGWNITDHLSDRYFGEGTESLYNVAVIVTGAYDGVLHAEPRRDPWYAPLQDPERQRIPGSVEN